MASISEISVLDVYVMPPKELVMVLRKAGWSQENIAFDLGITQSTVSRILSGAHAEPGYRIVDRLRALVLKLEEFHDESVAVEQASRGGRGAKSQAAEKAVGGRR